MMRGQASNIFPRTATGWASCSYYDEIPLEQKTFSRESWCKRCLTRT